MAISYTALQTTDTFQEWFDKTNEIGDNLSDNAVCYGGASGDNRGSGGVLIEGPLVTENTTVGVQTNILTPNTGTTIKLDANTVEFSEQQMIFTPAEGKNDTIQFVKGTTASANNKIWKIGPVDNHTDLDIVGRNADNNSADAIFTIRRSDGETLGLITGTDIKLDTELLKDDVAANTANQWATTRQISISGMVTGTAVDIDGTGNIEIANTTVDFSTVESGVQVLTIGDGLVTFTPVGGSASTAADPNIKHYVPNPVATTTSNSAGTLIEDLQFDEFGHVESVTTLDADSRYLLRNPTADANRSKLDGSGFVVESATKISFQKGNETANTNAEGFLQSSGNDDFIVSSGGMDNFKIRSDNKVFIQNRTGTSKFEFQTSNGNFIASGDITAFGSASDKSLKENIEPIENALEKVDAINGYTFNYIDAPEKGRVPGVIAQELEQVLPEAVYETEDGKKAVRYDNTVALLIEAIKELKQQVEDLKSTKG